MPADEILARFAALVATPPGDGEGLRSTAAGLEALRAELRGAGPDRVAELRSAAGGADPILLNSALGFVTGDLRHYIALLDRFRSGLARASLDAANQLYWSVSRQLFLMSMEPESAPGFLPRHLFPFFEALVEELRRRSGIGFAPRPADRAANGRVLLVTNQFLSMRHQPSRDLLKLADRLEERCGREVVILNTNMMPGSYHTLFVPPFAAAVAAHYDGKQIIEEGGRSYRFLSSAEPDVRAEKVRWFARAVEWYDPDVVLAFGGSVIMADLLAPWFPILCVPTTSGTAVSLGDIVLSFAGSPRPSGNDRLAASWRPYRFDFSLKGDPERSTREAWGLPPGGPVYAVIGNRLDEEADDGFIAILERILDGVGDEAGGGVVLFAGEVQALPGRLARSRHGAAFRCLGHVDRIRALLSVCDAFLNPRRTGGGASAVHALADGIPPVTLAVGDVAGVVGPDFRVADADSFVARAVALGRDPVLLAGERDKARRRFEEISGGSDDPGLLDRYLDEAAALFRERASA